MPDGRPHWLRVNVRGLIFLWAGTLLLCSLLAGESVHCSGTKRAWRCERHSDALLVRMIGVHVEDSVSSAEVKDVVVRSARQYKQWGQAVGLVRDGHDPFRFPVRLGDDGAAADRAVFEEFTREGGTLDLSEPAPFPYPRMMPWVLGGLALAASVYSLTHRPIRW